MIESLDPQVIIRTARKVHVCDCAWHHTGHCIEAGGDTASGESFCELLRLNPHNCDLTIQPGDRYPEYMGEVPAYQSGSRYCPPCARVQIGRWVRYSS